jgi:hypothetical protein
MIVEDRHQSVTKYQTHVVLVHQTLIVHHPVLQVCVQYQKVD